MGIRTLTHQWHSWRVRRWQKLLRYFDAWQVDRLISIRRWLVSDGHPTDALDQKINRYRERYHQAGAKYGASDAGMVKWFYERAQQ